jgi:uncharacterized membrane protein
VTKRWLGPLVLLVMAAVAVALYPLLPQQIPTHWGLSGEPDGWTSKWPGAFLFVGLAAGIWLLLLLLRRIDPRRRHYAEFEPTFWLILNVLVLFLALLQGVAFGAALGWPVDMPRIVLLAIGLMFVALGNYLPRVRSNWWVGVRTPWTLESERVWRATHRLAGRTFVAGGLMIMVAAILADALRPWVALAGLLLGGIVPVVYSYIVWRREKRAGNGRAQGGENGA